MKQRFQRYLLLLPVFALVGCQQPDRVLDRLPDPVVRAPRRLPPPVLVRPIERPEPPVVANNSGYPRDWMPSKGIQQRWKYIVIHHSGSPKSSPQGMDSWHKQKGWDGLGYHFVVGNGIGYPDGQIFVGDRWKQQKHGAHARTKDYPDNRWNEHGIGICLVGDFEHAQPTAKQIEATARLLAYLSGQCKVSSANIYTHGGVDRWTKCPGKNFPLERVKQRALAIGKSASSPVHASAN